MRDVGLVVRGCTSGDTDVHRYTQATSPFTEHMHNSLLAGLPENRCLTPRRKRAPPHLICKMAIRIAYVIEGAGLTPEV